MTDSKSVYLFLVNRQMRRSFGFFILCLTVSFITACDYGMTQGNQLSKKEETPPPFHQKTDISLVDVRAVAQETDKQINITKNYDSGVVPNIVTTSMGGEIGFKTKLLFEENLKDTDARFYRLESAVQDLSNKFIKIEPAIERLVKIDHDLGILTTQLEVLLNKQETPEFRTVPVNVATPNDLVASGVNEIIPLAGGDVATQPVRDMEQGKASLYAIRLSDHKDKARIVIDTAARFELEPVLDGNQLIIRSEIWANALNDAVAIQNLSSVVFNLGAEQQTGDLVMDLKRPVQNTKIGRIAPSADNPDYRTFIDLIF